MLYYVTDNKKIEFQAK